jgi:signal transduction histidine kinase
MQQASRVPIAVECPRDLAAYGSPDLLREALSALLENAIDHTMNGSIRVVAGPEANRVRIAVVDTGSGMQHDERARLFEPFFRSGEDGEGFGLGLAIAAQAVQAMGGGMAIEDVPEGACVAITLASAR